MRLKKKIGLAALILLALFLAGYILSIHMRKSTVYSLEVTVDDTEKNGYTVTDGRLSAEFRLKESGTRTKNAVSGNTPAMRGATYEVILTSQSSDTISRYSVEIPVSEDIWLNSSWNGKLEIYQNSASGGAKKALVDLGDYYDYSIPLDYYTDNTGIMIPLKEGDSIGYTSVLQDNPDRDSTEAKFGFTLFTVMDAGEHMVDFTGASVDYSMDVDIFADPLLYIQAVLWMIWAVWAVSDITTDIRTERIEAEKKKQKEHDDEIIKESMNVIVKIIENKDENTKGHSLRVAEYSKMLAEKLGYSEDACREVYYIGLMHDCGKINIPSSILKCPGKLTDEQYAVMKQHAAFGAAVLEEFEAIPDMNVGAKYHHERWDGKGYPEGLSGDHIPQIARIICVADAFDAMSHKRCYRDGLPGEYIVEELRKNSGVQFDPVVVKKLLELIDEDPSRFDLKFQDRKISDDEKMDNKILAFINSLKPKKREEKT